MKPGARLVLLGLAVSWTGLAAVPGLGPAASQPSLRPRGGPHGGTLVVVDGRVSVELVYDCPNGRLAAHVLDARGAPLPVRQDSLRLRVNYADVDGQPVNGAAARFLVELEPYPSEPAARAATEFRAYAPGLRGVCHLLGTIELLQVGERSLRDIPFRYPGP